MTGFHVTPDDLHSSGDTLGSFGDQIAKGGDTLQNVGNALVSHAGKDKSGVGSILVKALGKGTDVAGKVFSEGGRVAGAAGKRLHSNATAHSDNESAVAKSLDNIHDHNKTPPKSSPGEHGGDGGGKTSTSSDSSGGGTVKAPPTTNKTGDGNTDEHGNGTAADDQTYCGDPIDVVTGRMLLGVTDVELPGVLGLVLRRTHVSGYQAGQWFGASWTSTVDQRLAVEPDGLHLALSDGRLLTYPLPEGDEPVLPSTGALLPLRRIDGGWLLTEPETDQGLYFAATTGSALPLRRIADGDGNTLDFRYDTTGTITEVRHSCGYRVLVHTDDGLITALSLAGQATPLISYRYDERRRLVEVADSTGLPIRYTYDDAGRIVRWDDSNGMWYRYEFDADGRCVLGAGAGGYLNVTLVHRPAERVTESTDSLGNTTVYRYDERARVVAETDPLGGTTRFEWDGHRQLRSRTDPLGRRTEYGYDEDGNVVAVTHPDGTRSLAAYDADGRRTEMTGPDGAVWRSEYDERGRLRAETDPVGTLTRYDYDSAGALASVTDALGGLTRYENNAAGLPITVTDALGGVTRYRYDETGRVREVVDPLGLITRLSWTPEGELTERVDPDGALWRWAHDGQGNEVEQVDAADARTNTEYAHFDLPVAETGPDGGTLRYGYDTELRLATVTNEQGLVWRYDYDAAGNLVSETDYNGRVQQYRHDQAGQVIERITGAGEVVVLERDERGRIVRRTGADGEAVFGYDRAGRMTLARNADAEVRIGYDPAGRTVSETVNRRTLTSEYDLLGRRVLLRTPAGRESVWSYDALDRPTALRTSGRTLAFGWDAAGRQVSRELGGAVLRQEFDAAHRLTGQSLRAGDRTLQQRRYQYQPDGLLSAIDDALSGPRQLQLDPAGRVETVRGNGWQEHYGYDRAGNIQSAWWPAPADAPAIGPRRYAGTLLVAAGGISYTHDAEGRVTSRQRPGPAGAPETWDYRWNADSRLISVSTPDGHNWLYRYDALGRRIAKQRFDDSGRLLEQVDFGWDGAELVEQVRGGPGQRPILTGWDWEPGADRPVGQVERPLDAPQGSGQRFHAIVTDRIGSPAELVDEQGNLAWHARTSLWGNLLSGPGTGYTPLRFPGQYHDPETGLHYNLQRYYDPETGRYLSHDPLGLEAGPDSLLYVGNPTEWIDPFGLARQKCGAKGGAVASGSGGGGKKPPRGGGPGKGKPGGIGKPSPRRKYRPGTHGAKGKEQDRLGDEYDTKVSGDTHESEHPIGYEVIGGQTGVKRGTSGQASDIENHAPAYQEARPAHRGHIGTGTSVNPAAVGTSAFRNSHQYRDDQWNSLHEPAQGGQNQVSNAVQLNQLDYAHQQTFHGTTGTQGGTIADNSYHNMIDQQVGHGVTYATGPGHNASTTPVDNTSAAEMHLARGAARDGQWPSEQQISDQLYPPPSQAARDAQAAADGLPAGSYDPPDPNAMDVD